MDIQTATAAVFSVLVVIAVIVSVLLIILLLLHKRRPKKTPISKETGAGIDEKDGGNEYVSMENIPTSAPDEKSEPEPQ